MRIELVAVLLVGCAAPTFTEVESEILVQSCAFSTCHGAGAGDLDLGEGISYANLVNVPVSGRDNTDTQWPSGVDVSGEIRVIPGDPDNSYLIKKLTAADGINGSPMPDGSADGFDPEKVDVIRAWIENGALDD